MKREIKFRAYSEADKVMYDGWMLFLKKHSDEGSCSLNTTISSIQEEYVLMQFTGLHDKNGTEIYEGDIIIGLNGVNGTVIFKDGAFCFSVDMNPLVDFMVYSNTNEWATIIGNIHEHPELLKPLTDHSQIINGITD